MAANEEHLQEITRPFLVQLTSTYMMVDDRSAALSQRTEHFRLAVGYYPKQSNVGDLRRHHESSLNVLYYSLYS